MPGTNTRAQTRYASRLFQVFTDAFPGVKVRTWDAGATSGRLVHETAVRWWNGPDTRAVRGTLEPMLVGTAVSLWLERWASTAIARASLARLPESVRTLVDLREHPHQDIHPYAWLVVDPVAATLPYAGQPFADAVESGTAVTPLLTPTTTELAAWLASPVGRVREAGLRLLATADVPTNTGESCAASQSLED